MRKPDPSRPPRMKAISTKIRVKNMVTKKSTTKVKGKHEMAPEGNKTLNFKAENKFPRLKKYQKPK